MKKKEMLDRLDNLGERLDKMSNVLDLITADLTIIVNHVKKSIDADESKKRINVHLSDLVNFLREITPKPK